MKQKSTDVLRMMKMAAMPPGAQRSGIFSVCFGFFVLCIYTGAFTVLLRPIDTVEADLVGASDPFSRAGNIIVVLVLLMLFLTQKGLLRKVFEIGKPHCAILIVCFLSVAWSIYPIVTLRRATNFAACFAFACYAYEQYGNRGFIRLLAWSLLIPVGLSLVVAVILPSRAYDGLTSGPLAVVALHGVFTQKNQLSLYSLLGMCCWVYLGFLQCRIGDLDRKIRWVAVLILVTAMILSKGTTSIFATMVVVIAAVYMKYKRNKSFQAAFLYAAFLCFTSIIVFLVVDSEDLFKIFGKDASLTGRVPLWIECIRMIAHRPILGYGYGAFWNQDSVLTQYIWQQIEWIAPNAHNGFIQLALDIGIVGLVVYVILFGRIIGGTIHSLKRGTNPEAQWLMLIIIACFIENLDEGTLAWPDTLAVVIFFGAAMVSDWKRKSRGQRRLIRRVAFTPRVAARSGAD